MTTFNREAGANPALRLAILCSDEPHHVLLVRTLARQFNVVLVVEESGDARAGRLREEAKYRDWFWLKYHGMRRKLLGLDAYRRRYFADAHAMRPEPPGRRLRVGWVNDAAAVEALRGAQPDVTVVIGTSILKPPVLRATGQVAINVHGGCLPHYRGNHCFFFALYDGRTDRIGSTIHFVNEGVDTGDVIEHAMPEVRPGDNAEMLYCRAERLAIERLARLLGAYQSGVALPRQRQQGVGRTYRTRDRKPHHDLLLWFRRSVGRLNLRGRYRVL